MPHTTYYYRVRAYNGCATSLNSRTKSVQTLACTPAAPSAQSATNVTSSSFNANWRSVSGAIDYRLDVSTSSSFTTYVTGYQDLSVGNIISFPVTGLMCAHDLLLPSARLQWLCSKRQFQRQECADVALRSEGQFAAANASTLLHLNRGDWGQSPLPDGGVTPPCRAARKRSRKGTCLDFNLRLAALSEKKHARSTSGKLWYFPERGGHSSSNRFDLHSNGSGKSPSNAQACTILPPFCWIQPSSIHC